MFRVLPWRPACLVIGCLGLGLFLGGCGQTNESLPYTSQNPATSDPIELPGAADTPATDTPFTASRSIPAGEVDRDTILQAVVQLVREAATNPGGNNFDVAKDYLNEYFSEAPESQFLLSEPAAAYLQSRLGAAAPQAIADLQTREFTQRDARHIEDCLFLNTIAQRVAGNGDDLTRVSRVFDWLLRQVQLVPGGSLAPPGLFQAQARPFDVMMRAMATEEGVWAERSWLFLALCRQLGLDAGLIVHTQPPAGAPADGAETAAREPMVWACAVLIDGKAYLFDARIGLPITTVNGAGVATLDQVLSDPAILKQFDLVERPYSTHTQDLTPDRLQVWIDSTLGFQAPRMRELESSLAGRDRMILHRDPSEIDAAFRDVLGEQFPGTQLWALPMEVEYRLFNDPRFVESTLYAIEIFDSRFPLLAARMAQLRGEISEAVESYSAFRFAENPVENDGRTAISPQVQTVLDLYATYFLALAKLDQEQPALARRFFEQTLRLMPLPDPQFRPYFAMYRWGAHGNLGRLYEEAGDFDAAVAQYAEPLPTAQMWGNLIRARSIALEQPFVSEPTQTIDPPATDPPAEGDPL